MGSRENVGDRLLQRPAYDWGVAAVLVLMHLGLSVQWPTADLLSWFGYERRLTVYQALAGVIGIIVGFVITSLVFHYGSDHGQRVRFVERAVGDDLRRAWLGAVIAPLTAVAVLIVALIIDGPTNEGAPWIRWVVEGVTILVAIRLARLVWLFSRLLRLALSDEYEQTRRTTPLRTPQPKWPTRSAAG